MSGSGGLNNPYFTATYVGSVSMAQQLDECGRRGRTRVTASGDVPFLPAVWDSHLESDDSILPSSHSSDNACLCAFVCVGLREYAYRCAVYGAKMTV